MLQITTGKKERKNEIFLLKETSKFEKSMRK